MLADFLKKETARVEKNNITEISHSKGIQLRPRVQYQNIEKPY